MFFRQAVAGIILQQSHGWARWGRASGCKKSFIAFCTGFSMVAIDGAIALLLNDGHIVENDGYYSITDLGFSEHAKRLSDVVEMKGIGL